MDTLKNTVMPDPDGLRAQIAMNCPDTETDTIVTRFLSGMTQMLTADPRMYRSYGAYWPALKELAIRYGIERFGKSIDSDIAEIYAYDDDALTVAAALSYHHDRMEAGLQYCTQHMLPVDAFNEYEFNYADDEMERLVLKSKRASTLTML